MHTHVDLASQTASPSLTRTAKDFALAGSRLALLVVESDVLTCLWVLFSAVRCLRKTIYAVKAVAFPVWPPWPPCNALAHNNLQISGMGSVSGRSEIRPSVRFEQRFLQPSSRVSPLNTKGRPNTPTRPALSRRFPFGPFQPSG